MIITKKVETSLDIKNVTRFYTSDEVCLQMLRDKFEGKCFANCMILSVIRVLQKSHILIDAIRDPSLGRITVQFEVSGLVYNEGDIVTGCKVKAQNVTTMLCTTNNTTIGIDMTDLIKSIRNDQYINIEVIGMRYNLFDNVISIFGHLYIPSRKVQIFKVHESLTYEDTVYLQPLIAQVEDEMKIFEHLDATTKKFFVELYDPYKRTNKNYKSNDKLINILKLGATVQDKNEFTFIGRNPVNSMAAPEASIYGRVSELPEDMIIIENVKTVQIYELLIRDYIKYLKLIEESCAIYSDAEIQKSHLNLWRIYISQKKEL